MERLQRTFQISAAATLSAAAVMFAAAEGSAVPALTLPLSVFALLAIDAPQRPGLPGVVAVFLGGVALIAAVSEFVVGGIEARLLAPAHFVTYLTWIVILQKKQSRQYWLLFGLSILQIAIAALLTTAAWFGLALVPFSFLALWTLSSFTMYRAASRIDVARDTETGKWDGKIPDAARAVRGRSSVQSIRHRDLDKRIAGLRFAAGSIGTSVLSLMLAALFFLYVPRMWSGQFRLFNNSALASGFRPLTGFSEEVTLGDIGEVLSNDDLVLELQLFDNDSGAAIPPEQYFERLGSDSPLFRGMTHEIYTYGNWRETPDLYFSHARSRSSDPNLLQQTIRLQPTGSPVLFVAGDVRACFEASRDPSIEFNSPTHTFRNTRPDGGTAEFNYVALSAPVQEGILSGREDDKPYWGGCRTLQPGTERVTSRAVEIVTKQLGLPATAGSEIAERLTATEIAQILTAHLRDSGEFEYSLSLAVEDPRVDPLEDFVFNRKLGHCEYFASALAIMLRADEFAAPAGDGRGIPTRLVGGFKGGNVNARTGMFEVRQLHAHSWVEAYLDGRWMPLDPTPPARDLSVADLETASSTGVNRWMRAWENLWDSGVGLSKNDQYRLLYQPLEQSALETWSALQDVRGSSARLGAFLRSLFESPERWFSWRGGVTVFVLTAFMIIIARLLRKLTGILKHRRETTHRARRSRTSVPFLDRFARIVSRLGLRRDDEQTQLEFAEQTQQRLAAALELAGTAHLPEELTRKYYQVRFGKHPVSPEESAALDDRLDALEDALRGDGSRRERSN